MRILSLETGVMGIIHLFSRATQSHSMLVRTIVYHSITRHSRMINGLRQSSLSMERQVHTLGSGLHCAPRSVAQILSIALSSIMRPRSTSASQRLLRDHSQLSRHLLSHPGPMAKSGLRLSKEVAR